MSRFSVLGAPLVAAGPALAHPGAAHVHAGWTGPIAGLCLISLVGLALLAGRRA